MTITRGDIVLVSLAFTSGTKGKIRPVLVVQSDHNNRRLSSTIVAPITSNTSRVDHESTQFLVDITTPEGMESGLRHHSAVLCENLATIDQSRIGPRLGRLSPQAMCRIDTCLKAALGIAA